LMVGDVMGSDVMGSVRGGGARDAVERGKAESRDHAR